MLVPGAHFLIQDAAKGTVNLANSGDNGYVRTTPEKFVEVVANYAKSARRAAVPVEGAGDGGIELPVPDNR
jgi:hypothetical protein